MSKDSAQTRILRSVMLLAGNEFNGLRPGEIAKAVGTNPSNTTRDMAVLCELGLAERVPGMEERWRLGPKVVQIALAHLQHVERTKGRYDEMVQRFSRLPT